tara:strand:+ start:28788 stop:29519 length:732 start_codon:yes stop_codon:yes gene_type:complete
MLYKSITLILFLISINCNSQEIIKTFHQDSITNEKIADLKIKYGTNKILLGDYENQTLIALSYFPELKDIKIKFRLKNRTTPLATRPSLFSMFRSAKNRTYIITISKQSNAKLDTITLKNLNYNSQIGVIGHELSHVSDYGNKGFGKMWNVLAIEIFSKKKVDTFEYSTDLNCINHGLGYQLLDWSTNVRENLKRENWLGAVNLNENQNSERYMNPSTIINIINSHPLYLENTKHSQNCQEKE